VMEAMAKLKKPLLKKNWYIKQWVTVLPQCAFYPKENNTNQATKIKTLCSNVKYPKFANTQNSFPSKHIQKKKHLSIQSHTTLLPHLLSWDPLTKSL
jgi:hypothetical protein